MDDILDIMRREFGRRIRSDSQIQALRELIEAGTDYRTAEKYATRAGHLLSEILQEYVSPDLFARLSTIDPADLAHYIIPMLNNGYDYVSAASVAVQKYLNSRAGIGLQVVASEFDSGAAMNIVGKMCEYDDFADALYMLDEPVVQNLLQVVTDTLHANAEVHSRYGLHPKVIRRSEAGACGWCRSLAGVYDYRDVADRGNEVWKRHNSCRCQITYDPGDGSGANTR